MSTEPRRVIPTDSLFFALFPDLAVSGQIECFVQKLCAENAVIGRPLATKRFHVSLHHLGNFRGLPPEAIVAAEQAASTVAVPPFELTFDHVLSFKSKNADNKPLVLGIHQVPPTLTQLHRTLGIALKQTGFDRTIKTGFKPHLTLLYGDHQIVQGIEPITWTVREFVLVHSLLGKTRYIPLARWPLKD